MIQERERKWLPTSNSEGGAFSRVICATPKYRDTLFWNPILALCLFELSPSLFTLRDSRFLHPISTLRTDLMAARLGSVGLSGRSVQGWSRDAMNAPRALLLLFGPS